MTHVHAWQILYCVWLIVVTDKLDDVSTRNSDITELMAFIGNLRQPVSPLVERRRNNSTPWKQMTRRGDNIPNF